MSENKKQPNFGIYVVECLFTLEKACGRRESEIKKSIQDLMTSFKNDTEKNKVFTTDLFYPFKKACESKNVLLITTSLNCLQRLISTSLQQDPCSDLSFVHQTKEKELVIEMLKTICACGLYPSDEIALKVIQNILIIITSYWDVHSHHLFMAIRTCFHIYLSTKNAKNKTCSRATLAQIFCTVFDRAKELTRIIEKTVLKKFKLDSTQSNEEFFEIELENEGIEDLFYNKKQKNINMCKEIVVQIIQKRVFKDMPGKFGYCVSCNNSADNFCLHTKDPVCSMTCKLANLSSIIESEETELAKKHALSLFMLHFLYHNDCLLIFRSFCSFTDNSSDDLELYEYQEDNLPLKLQNKELVLEMILHILKGHSNYLKTSKQFSELAKNDLIKCLMHNIFSRYSTINKLAITIFLEILENFKTHLKTEIGVFLDCLFIKMIESQNSNFKQKYMCLLIFVKICSNEQALVDIFLNYDCNSNIFRTFRKIVECLEKLTQKKLLAKDWITDKEETDLKIQAITCFRNLFQSLLSWTNKAIELRAEASARDSEVLMDIAKSSGFNAHFSEKKEREKIIQSAIIKFSDSPKVAISMLKSINVIKDNSSESIALFLYKTQSLNKEAIGKFLGNSENADVLDKYVHLFDFTGLEIDVAIRKFLNNFLLNGESQMIDRVMSKFSVKYCFDNPEVFTSSDSAHILAFSIIMLNTDIHSKRVLKKMSKDEFVKNNQGVCRNENINVQLLEEIYNRISTNEIKFDQTTTQKEENLSTPNTRKALFKKEENEIKETIEKYVKTSGNDTDLFVHTARDNIDIVFRMFESVWSSSLASLSILLEKTENANIISLCLETYTFAIKLATIFEMDIIKEAYINTLAGLTLLGTNRVMQPKNIKAIRTLLEIANSEGNSLDKSWLLVLRCISSLEYLHLIGTGKVPDYKHFEVKGRKEALLSAGLIENVARKSETENTKTIAMLIDPYMIDRIFLNSGNLRNEKINTFFKYLCQVAEEELMDLNEPRVFSLEKLVETTFINLHRDIETWKEIWEYQQALFCKVSTVKTSNIVKYVINSYRAIVVRFLKNNEFCNNLEFQLKLFEPMTQIMARVDYFFIRELILQCNIQIVLYSSKALVNGWDSILKVATLAVRDSREKIVELSINLFLLIKDHSEEAALTRSSILKNIFLFLSCALDGYLNVFKNKALDLNFYYLIKLLKTEESIFEFEDWKTVTFESNEKAFCLAIGISNLINFIFSTRERYQMQRKTIANLSDLLSHFLGRFSEKALHSLITELIFKPILNGCADTRFSLNAEKAEIAEMEARISEAVSEDKGGYTNKEKERSLLSEEQSVSENKPEDENEKAHENDELNKQRRFEEEKHESDVQAEKEEIDEKSKTKTVKEEVGSIKPKYSGYLWNKTFFWKKTTLKNYLEWLGKFLTERGLEDLVQDYVSVLKNLLLEPNFSVQKIGFECIVGLLKDEEKTENLISFLSLASKKMLRIKTVDMCRFITEKRIAKDMFKKPLRKDKNLKEKFEKLKLVKSDSAKIDLCLTNVLEFMFMIDACVQMISAEKLSDTLKFKLIKRVNEEILYLSLFKDKDFVSAGNLSIIEKMIDRKLKQKDKLSQNVDFDLTKKRKKKNKDNKVVLNGN